MAWIQIIRLRDHHSCDDCGSSYADGAEVFINGELCLTLTPIAHCYRDVSYGDEEILQAIIRALGHDVEFV